jgi:hypothetical protein
MLYFPGLIFLHFNPKPIFLNNSSINYVVVKWRKLHDICPPCSAFKMVLINQCHSLELPSCKGRDIPCLGSSKGTLRTHWHSFFHTVCSHCFTVLVQGWRQKGCSRDMLPTCDPMLRVRPLHVSWVFLLKLSCWTAMQRGCCGRLVLCCHTRNQERSCSVSKCCIVLFEVSLDRSLAC